MCGQDDREVLAKDERVANGNLKDVDCHADYSHEPWATIQTRAKAACIILFRAKAGYQYVIGSYSNWEKAGAGYGAWLDRLEGIIANKQRKTKELERVSKK